mgnify:CR=1 FL=1
MPNEYDEWLDEIIDGKPTEITYMQLATIDSLIQYTTLTTSMQDEIIRELQNLTELEATQIIKKLRDNEITIDPKRQYEKMRKAGVFRS